MVTTITIQFYRVLPSFIDLYRVLSSFTEFAGFCQVLPSLTEWLPRFRSSFTEFYRVLLNFTEFYRVLPSFPGFIKSWHGYNECDPVLPSFTEFYWPSPRLRWWQRSCTEFYLIVTILTQVYRVSALTELIALFFKAFPSFRVSRSPEVRPPKIDRPFFFLFFFLWHRKRHGAGTFDPFFGFDLKKKNKNNKSTHQSIKR